VLICKEYVFDELGTESIGSESTTWLVKEYDFGHESVRPPFLDVTRLEHGLRSKNKLFLDWRLTDGCALGNDSRV
jgi:hypothetical protein